MNKYLLGSILFGVLSVCLLLWADMSPGEWNTENTKWDSKGNFHYWTTSYPKPRWVWGAWTVPAMASLVLWGCWMTEHRRWVQ